MILESKLLESLVEAIVICFPDLGPDEVLREAKETYRILGVKDGEEPT